MHSRTFSGPLAMLPTGPAPPIESLEEGRLERVHSGTGTGGSVIWDWGTGSIAWRCVYSWFEWHDVQIASVLCAL
jgi:hypothetical protein